MVVAIVANAALAVIYISIVSINGLHSCPPEAGTIYGLMKRVWGLKIDLSANIGCE